jgi:hypothetical protein
MAMAVRSPPNRMAISTPASCSRTPRPTATSA